jgi:hypothetical protein
MKLDKTLNEVKMQLDSTLNHAWKLLAAGLAAFVLFMPQQAGAQDKVIAAYTFADTPIKLFQNAMFPGSVANDRNILLGSVGSDLWRGPSDPRDEFWMVTDRGPNGQFRVDGKNRRTFWIPEFNPAIVRVKLEGKSMRILQSVPIVGQSGKPVTGLPNLKGIDETPYEYTAKNELPFNVNGIDSEGLVRTASGDFWISEEYTPSLLHVDRTGKVLKRYVPEGIKLDGADYPVAAVFPAIYGKRKINRGFEGLAISGDQNTLYVTLQSPLLNPDRKTGNNSRNTRLIAFDIKTEKVTAEYAYQFDVAKEFDPDPKTEPDEMKLSGVVFINPTNLLVLERTDLVAKLYAVDLSKATNILNTKWDDPKTNPTLEALEDPASAELRVLPKSLVVDLKKFKEMPDKIEGVAIIDRNTIAVVNDNDFDSEENKYDAAGNNVGKGKKTQMLIISLSKPLPLP